MGMRTILLTFVCLWATHVSGQELVFSEPVKLGSQINSDDEELAPLLSSDGKTLYFSRAFHANNMGGKYAGTDIWVSKKDDKGNWMPASNMTAHWNNKRSNAVIGVNHDHSVVYLLNAYSNKSGISFSKINSGIWGEPEFIPIPGINRDDFVGIYVHPDFDVIIISMKGADSNGEEDLYVSLKDSFGNWTAPKNLGPTINTRGFEISPFLSLDKKRLFFSSNGHQGFGDADIFYCDRLFDSWETWGVPRNLGEFVNSKMFDGFSSIIGDSLLILSSNRSGKTADLYISKSQKKRKQLKQELVQQYLSNQEVLDLLGVDPVLTYDLTRIDLTDAHKQILIKVSSVIISKPEFRCSLIALKTSTSSDLEIYQKRLLAVLDFMKERGIEGSRISLGLEQDNGSGSRKEQVQVRFVK